MKIISVNSSINSQNQSFGCKYCEAIRELLVNDKNLISKEIADKFVKRNLGEMTDRGLEFGPHSLSGGNLISRGSLLVGDAYNLAKNHKNRAYKLFTALQDMHNDKEVIDLVLKDAPTPRKV